MKTHYIIQTAKAQMPSSCKGNYRKVAVLEVDEGLPRVSMISERAKGVKRIVAVYDRLNVGKTSQCAYQKALREAECLVDELNFERMQGAQES